MAKPTKTEIAAEIKKLIELKPRVHHQSIFGDDHHAAIDAMVAVLQGILDQDGADEIEADYVRDAATQAVQWLEGSGEKLSDPSEWPMK